MSELLASLKKMMTQQAFRNLPKMHLTSKLKKTEIEEIYRLGKKTQQKPMRDLVVRFKKKSTRQQFYKNRKSYSPPEGQHNIYINDHLTEHRSSLFYSARKLVKSKVIHSAWSQQGNILIRKQESDKPMQINSHQELARIKEELQEHDEDDDTNQFSDGSDSSDED